MQATKDVERPAVGDVIVGGGHHVGGERNMGEILEVRGDPAHERYRVRWEDGHESIFQPADGDATIHHYAPHGASAEIMRALNRSGIEFEPLRHPRTMTARDEAQMLHASPDRVGKTIVVNTPEGRARVVIQASERLGLGKLRDGMGSTEVRLVTEEELAVAYPGFELGTVPPFGGPDGERVIVDRRIVDLETVIVEAGSHSDSVRIATVDLMRITDAKVMDVIAD